MGTQDGCCAWWQGDRAPAVLGLGCLEPKLGLATRSGSQNSHRCAPKMALTHWRRPRRGLRPCGRVYHGGSRACCSGDWRLIVPDTIEHRGAVQHPELGSRDATGRWWQTIPRGTTTGSARPACHRLAAPRHHRKRADSGYRSYTERAASKWKVWACTTPKGRTCRWGPASSPTSRRTPARTVSAASRPPLMTCHSSGRFFVGEESKEHPFVGIDDDRL